MKSRIFYGAWLLTALLMVATLPWLPASEGDGSPQFNREAYRLFPTQPSAEHAAARQPRHPRTPG